MDFFEKIKEWVITSVIGPITTFFENLQAGTPLALTFDDVLIRPRYSEVLPRQANTRSQLTKNIWINSPLISAAMDTVTEAKMAIAMAQNGGIGILHKNMGVEEQVRQILKVKRYEAAYINDPATVFSNENVAAVLHLMKENKIGGVPVIDPDSKKLVGLITNRDLIDKNKDQQVTEVMKPVNQLITAKEGTTIEEARNLLIKNKVEKLPVVDKKNILKGLYTYKDISKTENYPFASKDKKGRLRVGAAVGITSHLLEDVAELAGVETDVITVDTAHGHSLGVINAVKQIKAAFPDLEVIAGNVSTAEGAKALVDAGADAVKVGQGPGSICTTRVVAGIGIPQLSAVQECSKALKGTGIPVIADGGIRYPGDFAKAIVAGASTIMAGSIFAGTEQSPGEKIFLHDRMWKEYRGMGSIDAMNAGSADRYFQDMEDDVKKFVSEGVVARVPYKGDVKMVIYKFLGGLKAAMGYTGSKDIATLQTAEFRRITNAGITESHPHDVTVTKEE